MGDEKNSWWDGSTTKKLQDFGILSMYIYIYDIYILCKYYIYIDPGVVK